MAACSSNGMQSICLFLFLFFIIRDEFEFDDLKYCVLISVLRFTGRRWGDGGGKAWRRRWGADGCSMGVKRSPEVGDGSGDQ